MPLEKYEDSLELSTIKSNFPRSDNVGYVKSNFNVVKAAKLDKYFSYLSRFKSSLIQLHLKDNINSNQYPKELSKSFPVNYSKKFVQVKILSPRVYPFRKIA